MTSRLPPRTESGALNRSSALLRSMRLAGPYAAGTAVVTATLVLSALHSVTTAAALSVAAMIGGVVGSFTAGLLLNLLQSRGRTGLLTHLLVGNAATLLVAASLPERNWIVIGVLLCTNSALWNIWKITLRETAGQWGPVWLRRVGPLGRVGAVGGSLVGTAVAVSGLPVLLLLLLAGGPFLAPRGPAASRGTTKRTWSFHVFATNTALVVAGYGPITLDVAFIAATAGPQWAGVAMGVFTLGALTGPTLAQKLPDVLHHRAAGRVGLASLANLTWLFVILNPLAGALVARGLSGALLFTAEGSADLDAHRRDAWVSAFAGRSIGTLLASSTGFLVLSTAGTVPAAATVYTLIGGALLLSMLVAGHVLKGRGAAGTTVELPSQRPSLEDTTTAAEAVGGGLR